MRPPDLSLVVPAYNERDRLPSQLDRLAAFARERLLSLEIVVADDGSDDGTGDAFRTWAARHGDGEISSRLVSITHRGKGAAVRAGMSEVHPAAPIVGYCDADLSAGPDAIVQLLATIDGGADIAIASRGLPASVLTVRQPWYREGAGRLLNVGLRTLIGMPFKDTQCGLKLFRAAAARLVFRHQRLDGFAFDIELLLVAMKLGLRIEEVPIRWAHVEGSQVSVFRDSYRMARDTMRVFRRLRHEDIQTPGVPGDEAMSMLTDAEDRHWWHVAKRRLVTRQLPTAQAPRLCLDIGCGGGAMLAEAAEPGEGVGMDLSEQALKSARARGLRALLRGEASALPLASGSCSAVLALDVLEHHARPEMVLEEILRVLAPGGRLVVTVPAYQWMWSYSDDVLGHYRRYTKRRLAKELASAGFVIRRSTYFHSWLLPAAWTFRLGQTILGRTKSADDFELPGSVNRFLLGVSDIELTFSATHNLPFGLSVLAVCHKPDGTVEL